MLANVALISFSRCFLHYLGADLDVSIVFLLALKVEGHYYYQGTSEGRLVS